MEVHGCIRLMVKRTCREPEQLSRRRRAAPDRRAQKSCPLVNRLHVAPDALLSRINLRRDTGPKVAVGAKKASLLHVVVSVLINTSDALFRISVEQ